MKGKQIVLSILILCGLGVILFFTFDFFKKEEKNILENARQNDLIEKLEEEKKKQEKGQTEVDAFLEKLKETKKIILGIEDANGTLEVLDNHHQYREIKTIVEEATIQEILSLITTAKWEENKNSDYKGKIWQFYDSENNLILEYDGHSFVTKEKTTNIFISQENEERLNRYFTEV